MYGSLSQKKGKAISDSDYHKAPCNFGLYAFPIFFDEPFLVDWKYCDEDSNKSLINEALVKKGINPNDFWSSFNNNDDAAFNLFEQITHKIYKEKNERIIKLLTIKAMYGIILLMNRNLQFVMNFGL